MERPTNATTLHRTRQELGWDESPANWPNVFHIESVRFERTLAGDVYYSRESGQYVEIHAGLLSALFRKDVKS